MKFYLESKLFLVAVITIKTSLFWEVRHGNRLFSSYHITCDNVCLCQLANKYKKTII